MSNISHLSAITTSKRLRMIWIVLLFCIMWNNLLIVEESMGSSDHKFLPPDDKVLVVIGQDIQSIDDYVKAVDVVPAGFMVYTSIQNMDGLYQSGENYGSGINNAQALLRKHSNTTIQLGLYMVNALEEILNGKYDHNIRKLSQWLVDINVPVYLRIGYEFDGGHNHYDPEQYKKAYRYIVDRLKQQKVHNVAYVWHSKGFLTKNENIMDWYPGDEYVDWFGISYFHLYHEEGRVAIVNLAEKHNKPLMIAEATPYGFRNQDGHKIWNRWFNRFFQFIEKYDVKMFCYINVYWDKQKMWKGQGWGDSRVEGNDYIKIEWLKKMEELRYLNSSVQLYKSINFYEVQQNK